MKFTKTGKIYLLILLANLTFAIFAIAGGGFAYLGLSFSLIFFLTLARFIKNDSSKTTNYFYIIASVLSLMLIFRSEGFITFLNIFAIFGFGSLMLVRPEFLEKLSTVITAPIQIALGALMTNSKYFLDVEEKSKSDSKLANNVVGVLITILTLSFIIPLLASSNPIFKSLINSIVNALNLQLPAIDNAAALWLVRAIVFLFLSLTIPRLATFINLKEDLRFKINFPSLNLFLPKLATTAVLLIFFATQIQLYFSSAASLAELGYTHSQYAREVFAQLTAVAAIIFLLLYNDSSRKKLNKIFTYVLSVSAIFLVFMAYKSVYEYVDNWGLTYKRLYGFTVATWIFGVFIIYLNDYFTNKLPGLIKKLLIFSGVILILVNLANFDALIYHFKKSTTGEGIDYEYLSRLSADSLSYKEQLDTLISQYENNPTEESKAEARNNGIMILLWKIEVLQKKYNDMDIREFNTLEYLQFQEVKNVDTKSLRTKFEPVNPIFGRPQPQY